MGRLKFHILRLSSMWAKIICFSLLRCCSIFLETTVIIWFHRFYFWDVFLSSCREVFTPPCSICFFLLSSGKWLRVSSSSLVLIWSMCDFLANCSAVLSSCILEMLWQKLCLLCVTAVVGASKPCAGMSYRIPLGSVAAAGPCWEEGCQLHGAGVITQASLADGREAHHVLYRVRYCLCNDFPEKIPLYIYIYILEVPSQLAANYNFQDHFSRRNTALFLKCCTI